jgi:translocation and assembly module TamB
LRLALHALPARIEVRHFELVSSFMNAKGHGDVEQGIVVDGDLALDALATQVGTLVDLGDWKPTGSGPFHLEYQRTSKGYVSHGNLKIDDLQLTTPGANAGPLAVFVPKTATLTAKVTGAADSAGWPLGWSEFDVEVKSKEIEAKAALTNDELGLASVAFQTVSLHSWKQREWVSRNQGQMTRQSKLWRIEQARFELATRGGDFGWPKPEALVLDVTGQFDTESNTLQLLPRANPESDSALVLGPAGIRVNRLGQPDWNAQAALSIDVQRFDRIVQGNSPFGLTGGIALSANLESGDGSIRFQGNVGSHDLGRVDAEGRTLALSPTSLSISGEYASQDKLLSLQTLLLKTPYGALEAAGSLNLPIEDAFIDVKGRFEPNWETLNALIAERVEPNARVTGRAREFWARGWLDPHHGNAPFKASFGLDLESVDVYGMRLGPTPLAAHWDSDSVTIEPINTTLNGGRIHLKPELTRLDDASDWTLGIAPGSGIENAEINDEVSHRVLAFVAPVLDRATRVNGAVSARFERVAIPLSATAADDAIVEGTVLFHNVTFEPGPMAMRLYAALGIAPMSMRLDQPVLLAIADGVVHQRGFSMPLGTVAHVLMDGEVGFDRSLALNVRVPMSGSQFASVPVFNRIAPALRLEFPIRGTLDDPKIDGKAMGQAMGRVGLDVAQSAGFGGIEALIRQASTPRSPEEEARLKAEREERQRLRREKQMQKKEEQRLKREERQKLRDLNSN